MPNFISEDQIERALLQNLQHVHGYDVLECGTVEREDLADGSGRADKREVFLLDRLKAAAVFNLVLDHASHGRKWAA